MVWQCSFIRDGSKKCTCLRCHRWYGQSETLDVDERFLVCATSNMQLSNLNRAVAEPKASEDAVAGRICSSRVNLQPWGKNIIDLP